MQSGGADASVYNKRVSGHSVRRWHSGVREVGAVGHIGGSNALGGDENALGGDENAYAALHWGELTSWGLTAGKEGGWSLYFPRTPYLVNGEWTKDLTGVCLVFDGVVLWYPGVGLG